MMFDYYFTFRSITAAQTGAHMLERAGISSTTARTPKHLQKQGCGYSVRVRENQFRIAQEVLLQNGAKFNKVYCRLPDGTWEEVTA